MTDQPKNSFIHESAWIDEGATVGKGTTIWHCSHIMADCVIGEGCNFGQNVVISPGCSIGNNVKIQNNVSVYSGVTLEDDVFCGPSMVFTNVINPRSYISRKNEFKKTLVKRGASIGANATIICGCTLGSYCLIGAGTVVTRNVPDFGLVVGNPGRLRGFVCYCGEKLAFSSRPDESNECVCDACDRSYRQRNLLVELLAS